MFLTIDHIIRYIESFGLTLDISILTDLQKSYLFIGGNILWFIVCFFVFSILYRILSRFINYIF